jgi:hypothetical protein
MTSDRSTILIFKTKYKITFSTTGHFDINGTGAAGCATKSCDEKMGIYEEYLINTSGQ